LSRGIFFLSLALLAGSCASPAVQNVQDAFYLGLTETGAHQKEKLFEKALLSPNEYVRRASAEELAILMQRGNHISSKTMKIVRKEAHGFWADAFEVTDDINKEKALSFLAGVNLNTASFYEAREFVLSECQKKHIDFTEEEIAIIRGHYYAARSWYKDALEIYAALQVKTSNDGEEQPASSPSMASSWPEKIPALFIQYPGNILSFGRTFQYTESGNAGTTLFLKWEAELAAGNDDALKIPRYNLLYSAGRIARARGQASAASIFERALAVAPNKEESDRCIWNLLSLAVESTNNTFINRLERYIPLWHNSSYFIDVMEQYMQRLTARQDWNKIIRIFTLVKNTDADVQKAASAWLIQRAIEEKLLSASDSRLAAQAVNSRTAAADPLVFARIAYDASYSISIPSLYYRCRTASALRLPFLEFSENTAGTFTKEPPSQALQFLLDFFNNNIAELADPYIRAIERDLSPAELRALSEAYAEAEIYNLSMRVITAFINRESYKKERRDLELAYPRPYLKLIESYAKQYNLAPSMMLGLIRAESAFQHAVVSRAGAVGLAQFMPATAKDVAARIHRAGGPNYASIEYNSLDRTIPEVSVHMGSFYLNMRRNELNDIQLALMAYNGGVPRIRRAQNANPKLPPDLIVETHPTYETRDYGRRVVGFAAVYEALYY